MVETGRGTSRSASRSSRGLSRLNRPPETADEEEVASLLDTGADAEDVAVSSTPGSCSRAAGRCPLPWGLALASAIGCAVGLSTALLFTGASPIGGGPLHTPAKAWDRRELVALSMEADKVKALLGTATFTAAVGNAQAVQETQRLRTARCTLNVLQAANYLARAGMQIDQAVKTCQDPSLVGYSGTFKKEACAANAAGVFASIAWVATYLSLAASQCGKAANVPAVCAATIEGIVAALSSVAVHGNFVAANCNEQAAMESEAATASDAIWQPVRRLRSADAGNRSADEGATGRLTPARRLQSPDGSFPPDRDSEIATCVLDVTTATTSLSEMGVAIKAATVGCQEFQATRPVPIVKDITQAVCAVDIGDILFSVGQAATFIAAATSHCAEGLNVQAICASGIAGLLTTLAGVVYMGSGIDLACTQLHRLGPLQNPAMQILGSGFGRRLLGAGNATAA